MLQAATLVIFPAIMIFAALSDLFTMTISNRISIALVLIFLPFALLAGMPLSAIGLHIACGAAVLVLTFGLFAMNWIGGGDAKLAASTAVWMGWEHLSDFGFDTALIGGALTLAILYMRHVPLPSWAVAVQWITRLHDRASGVPYGIALAASGLLLYPQTGIWSAASLN